jgi:hypothetical protein
MKATPGAVAQLEAALAGDRTKQLAGKTTRGAGLRHRQQAVAIAQRCGKGFRCRGVAALREAGAANRGELTDAQRSPGGCCDHRQLNRRDVDRRRGGPFAKAVRCGDGDGVGPLVRRLTICRMALSTTYRPFV